MYEIDNFYIGGVVVLHISNEAAAWYKNEMGLRDGEFLRFFVKLYGESSIHPNYSLGVAREQPRHLWISSEVEGITFYFDEQDAWYIDNYRMTVQLNEEEIRFEFIKQE